MDCMLLKEPERGGPGTGLGVAGMRGLGRAESRVLKSLGFQEAGAPRQGSALGFLSLECLGKGRRHKGMVTAVMLGL